MTFLRYIMFSGSHALRNNNYVTYTLSYKETYSYWLMSYFIFIGMHYMHYKLLLIKTCIVTTATHHNKKTKCYIDKETYKNGYFVSLNWVSTFQLFKHRFFNFKIFEFNFQWSSMIFQYCCIGIITD